MKSFGMNPAVSLELSNARNQAVQRFTPKMKRGGVKRFLSRKTMRQTAAKPRRMRALARFLPRHSPRMIRQSSEQMDIRG